MFVCDHASFSNTVGKYWLFDMIVIRICPHATSIELTVLMSLLSSIDNRKSKGKGNGQTIHKLQWRS